MPMLNEKHHVDVRPKHHCSSKREILIQCLDDYGELHRLYAYMHRATLITIYLVNVGVEHTLLFTCCDCECVANTLIRANLWPATPHYPRYAFSFALLDWAESLLLECQVALKDFYNALKFRCPFHISKVFFDMYKDQCVK